MELVSSAELSISYDGAMVRTGLMDVQELAPALLASGVLIQKANSLLNGETTSVRVQVKSDFRRGSFLVNFVVDQSMLEQAKNFLLQHPNIKDAKEILETIFFYVGMPTGAVSGLFKLIKFLRNKKPDSITIEDKTSTVNFVLGDQHLTTNKNTYILFQDPEARRAASTLVEPLNREGVETLEIRRGDEVETVNKEEAQAFTFGLQEGEMLLDNVTESWLSIISLSFNPEHKWRFTTGGSVFTARIIDHDFWGRVHKHEEKFEEGDQLRVALRTSTYRDPVGTLRTTYVIERVVEHRNIPKQRRLNL